MEATKDIIQLKWVSLKELLRRHWIKITEDDLVQVNGNTEELINILRKHYGYGKAQAEIELRNWLTDLENSSPSDRNSW